MDAQIRAAVRKLAGTQLTDEVYLLPATVEAVDLTALTCDCTAIGGTAAVDLVGVRLMAEVDDGLVQVPAIGSTVLVMYSKRETPYIAMYSELQGFTLHIGNSAVEVDSDLIKLNGGNFGGLVKVSDLVSRLNAIENAFNALNTKVNGLAPTPVIPPITPTTKVQIENPIITHGG